MNNKITGIILAGGKSSRMGTNKAFVNFNGKRLIEHSINLMQSICDEVIISANDPCYEIFNLPVVKDNYCNKGPLGGIEASLSYSKTVHNLFIPCDTPYISSNLYFEILKYIDNELVIVPVSNRNKLEPLTAYYSKEILPIIHQQIKNGNYKIQDLFNNIKIKHIYSKNSDMFKNLNTPNDIHSELSLNTKTSIMQFPNLILIAGDGRNVGKTYLTCEIIKHLSTFTQVTAIKVSPHIHEQEEGNNIIFKNENFIIIDEKLVTNKDSSLMLQAGAKQVFFIMAKQEHLAKAFSFVSHQLADHPIVCESGGLHEVVQPGLFLFVKPKEGTIQKKNYLKYDPKVVTNHQKVFDFDKQCIGYKNNQVTINNLVYDQI